MHRNPTDLATNVLYNQQAMAIIEGACARLQALGLHSGFAGDCMFPESEMSVVLRVSTSAQSLDETIVGSLVASDFTDSPGGRAHFDERLAQFRADCAIGKAMDSPDAKSAWPRKTP